MSEPVSSDPEELREQIEQTRAELADTVQALAGKADIKGRAKAQASELTAQAKVQASELTAQAKVQAGQVRTLAAQETQVAKEQIVRTQAEKPWLFPAAGALALVGLVTAFVLRRRRT
jgi:MYXO-CTERM domain-containing protein